MNGDVVVIGAGITSITTAHLLKETGLTVALIERERVASMDTGHTTAHLTCITDVELQELAHNFGDDHAQAAWDAGAAAIDESKVRKAGAWAAEKAGRARLMIAGDEPGGSGLALTLEGLIMGVTGKKLMWRGFAAVNLPQLSGYDFKELERRADQQIERIEIERIRAAQQAFAGTVAAQ